MKNKRILYSILTIIVVAAGLSTRTHKNLYPSIVGEFAGDVLYATMIFLIVRFINIKVKLAKVAITAYLFCICIETLQLYHATWLEKIRHTFPFGLFLGYKACFG